MSKIAKSSVLAAVTLAAVLVAIQAPASASPGLSSCSDPVWAQKNFFRCMQLNGN